MIVCSEVHCLLSLATLNSVSIITIYCSFIFHPESTAVSYFKKLYLSLTLHHHRLQSNLLPLFRCSSQDNVSGFCHFLHKLKLCCRGFMASRGVTRAPHKPTPGFISVPCIPGPLSGMPFLQAFVRTSLRILMVSFTSAPKTLNSNLIG